MLPSGLPEVVANDEDLARFLTSSRQFTGDIVKPLAFLPEPKERETSVSRHGSEPRASLWQIGDEVVAGKRNLHGAAMVRADDVRAAGLDVFADEPPPRHAAIRGWPWLDGDSVRQKAQQKELAAIVANRAMLVRR